MLFKGGGFGLVLRGLNNYDMEALCWLSIDLDQQVLMPLTSLRGIRNVAVVGRITPERAEIPKACMSAEPGAVMEAFVR